MSVQSGSPAWSKLLRPIDRAGIKWGGRGFKWEGNRAFGDSPMRMPATVGVFLMLRFSSTRVDPDFARQTLIAPGAVVVFVR